MPTPRALVLHRGEANLQIDGSLLDWPGVPPIRLDDTRQISGTSYGTFRGPGDLNAQAFLTWDEKALYFGAKVLDDVHVPLSARTPQFTEIPPTDSITLTFDPRRDTRAFGPDAGRREDGAFWLGAQSEVPVLRVLRWDVLRGDATVPDDVKLAVVRDEEAGLTTYEARIAWSEIFPDRTKAAPDDILDLQVVLDDVDVMDDIMSDTRIGWTFGTGVRIDPALFGSIWLSAREAGSTASVQMPEFPPPPGRTNDAVPAIPYWIALHKRLQETEPVLINHDTVDPTSAGPAARRDWLRAYENHVLSFPRQDFLRLQMAVQRRMVRESAGMSALGLPFYWQHVLGKVGRDAKRDSPARGFRLYRLPQGGWLVRSNVANFLIDSMGLGIDKVLLGWCDFALFTAPSDLTKRSDQLLSRMLLLKENPKPFLHILRGLPGATMDPADLVVPGERYSVHGVDVTVIGDVDDNGMVTSTTGFFIEWPDGSTLVVSGMQSTSDQLPKPKSGKFDVLILSARHAIARVFGQRIGATYTVLDDVLQCAAVPGPHGRVSLDDAYELQRGLRPFSSMIMGPGEWVESSRRYE